MTLTSTFLRTALPTLSRYFVPRLLWDTATLSVLRYRAKTFCKFISVAGTARQRIRNAARRNDDRVALDIPVACGDNKNISRLFHAFDNGIKPYFDAVFQKRVAQRFYDVGRFIAFRETLFPRSTTSDSPFSSRNAIVSSLVKP